MMMAAAAVFNSGCPLPPRLDWQRPVGSSIDYPGRCDGRLDSCIATSAVSNKQRNSKNNNNRKSGSGSSYSRNSINNLKSNNNSNSMTNGITSVIVSDRGPPLPADRHQISAIATTITTTTTTRSTTAIDTSATASAVTTIDATTVATPSSRGVPVRPLAMVGNGQRRRRVVHPTSDQGLLVSSVGFVKRWRLTPMLMLVLMVLSALPNSCSGASIQAGRRSGQYRHHPYHLTTTVPTTTTTSTTTTTTVRPLALSSRTAHHQCPWLAWEPDSRDVSSADALVDVAGTRAYMAPVVFEGKARSRSDGPVYRVTFDVVTVYKGEVATGSQVRLEFKSGQASASSSSSASGGSMNSKSLRSLSLTNSNSAARSPHRTLSADRHHSVASSSSSSSSSIVRSGSGSSSAVIIGNAGAGGSNTGISRSLHHRQHHHRHQHHNRECLVTADIRTGRRYLVFAAHWGPNNFTAYGSPLVHTKKSLKDVRSTLCPRCARSPVAYGLEESVTVKKQQKLILRCRTRGNPVPSVSWYKDGKLLSPTGKHVRIKTKRRRSTLRIRCVKEEDAGLYECRPNNVVGAGTASRSRVHVVKVSGSSADASSKLTGNSLRPANGSSSLWPLIALPCPIDSFCLNGGTCKYYEAVGELVCQCAEGYKGQRCENKDIYNLGKGGKCRGGRLVGTKCVPTYGAVGTLGGGSGTPGSLLGPTAAAGWAAMPSSHHQLTWWHWLQAGKIGTSYHTGGNPDDGDDQSCGGDDDDDD